MLRPSYLEQAYRDARCGAAMLPWSVEVCLERLGRTGLYPELGRSAGVIIAGAGRRPTLPV